MEEGRLQVLHSHYQDTCSALQGFRSQRERFFYWILAALVLVLYDAGAPEKFGAAAGDLLNRQTGVSSIPDLSYLSTILFFILLGLALRYCQTVVYVERQYRCLHDLGNFGSEYGGAAFTRERSYLADYPAFANWAHYAIRSSSCSAGHRFCARHVGQHPGLDAWSDIDLRSGVGGGHVPLPQSSRSAGQ
jgi:uncharacterized membrane protein YhaH (DUF805 family)